MEKNQHPLLDTLLVNAALQRGKIVNDTILLERYIDEYISRYFCNDEDRKSDFMEWIICTRRITFHSKTEVFIMILEKINPAFFNKYSKTSLKSDLKDVMHQRNIFAHHLYLFKI